MSYFQPVIKWSGSKRSQAQAIVTEVPEFNRYFEPFIGGGSISYALSLKKELLETYANLS